MLIQLVRVTRKRKKAAKNVKNLNRSEQEKRDEEKEKGREKDSSCSYLHMCLFFFNKRHPFQEKRFMIVYQ
jgi:hypothetical protein